MSQSLTKVLIHLVFSTEYRRPLIREEIRGELQAYTIGILNALESPSLLTYYEKEHGHILFSLSKKQALARVVEEVKKGTSRWIKSKGREYLKFYWQDGYGAFAVSECDKEEVMRYISNQREHHRKITSLAELKTLFEQNGIAYDGRYL